MANNVVIVESPAKSKTINKYLGSDYTVLASFGHVRDLPSKDGSVRPDEDFAMDYEVSDDSKKHVKAIADAVKGASTIWLATDPDREGEAISWHLLEALRNRKALKKNTTVNRIVFHEITKRAVTEAIKHPREIDMDLVNAQQARRALDYLVGFNLSPVLWRKLPGAKSAGRVQSVALRIICERELEIEQFISQEFWDITLDLKNKAGDAFKARLTHIDDKKLGKFDIPNEVEAQKLTTALQSKQFTVSEVVPKQRSSNPPPPFSTSTLQMDASRKLGFGAKQTMQVAQKLYEGIEVDGETVGLITYMRTDAMTVAQEALDESRGHIAKAYGQSYLPEKARVYKTKAKNAQEAHEAIRPTSIFRTPQSLKSVLSNDQFRLYELIWKRMVASQMNPAIYDNLVVDLVSDDKSAQLRANGSVLRFDGYLKLYQAGRDEDDEDEESKKLPPLEEGERVSTDKVEPAQHFTQPPPRYTEASLVKAMEELGIGRPSTYASIISVLQDRDYVRMDQKRFIPESRGRLVSTFLASFFEKYVAFDFTAELENTLDDIADGEKNWKDELRKFWVDFIAKVEQSKELTITEVLDTLDKILEPYTFGQGEESEAKRKCPNCADGRLSLKTGKFGAFIGCSNYPECNYTKQLSEAIEGEGDANEVAYPLDLGVNEDGEQVSLRKGPYGVYVQLGEGEKPKRTGLPKNMGPQDVDLEKALALLSLPRRVGEHPETGKVINAGIGRFGPYLIHDKVYTTIPKEDDVLTIGMNRAVDLIAESAKKKKGGSKAEPLRVIGKHPDGTEIAVFDGRYGPYIKYKKLNVTVPKDQDVQALSLEEAQALIDKKAGAKKGKAKK
ncbi:MAG: DNA topoisomerase I [Rickettsiales bacterium]|nr:DNA topoisomerase I [Rickettsiales bacterium]